MPIKLLIELPVTEGRMTYLQQINRKPYKKTGPYVSRKQLKEATLKLNGFYKQYGLELDSVRLREINRNQDFDFNIILNDDQNQKLDVTTKVSSEYFVEV
jgi:hypothetical protein